MAAPSRQLSAAPPVYPARRWWKFITCSSRFASESLGRLGLRPPASQFDQRHDQKIHGQDPDENHLPEPQVPRTVMVARDLRVPLEKLLADPEDIEPAGKNDRQENAEDDSKREHRVAVFMDNGEDGAAIHIR